MARSKSLKNLTPAELKERKAGLKTALKAINAEVKGHDKVKAEAAKAFATATKEADKALTTATKAAEKAKAEATKVLEAVTKKADKLATAAAVGMAKIEDQLAEIEDIETAEA